MWSKKHKYLWKFLKLELGAVSSGLPGSAQLLTGSLLCREALTGIQFFFKKPLALNSSCGTTATRKIIVVIAATLEVFSTTEKQKRKAGLFKAELAVNRFFSYLGDTKQKHILVHGTHCEV